MAFLIGTLIDAAELLGILAVFAAILATYPRTRRCLVAIHRYGKRHMEPWQLAVVSVCLLIPGPLDELIVAPLLIVLTLRTERKRRVFRRYLTTAWSADQ